MEEQLRALLTGSAAITALVPAGRINWIAHPQGQPWPGIVLHLINRNGDHTLDGPSGIGPARVQVDCWARNYLQAKQIGRAVESVLDGYHGGPFMGVFLAGVRDGREGADTADRPFRSSLDFIVRHRSN
ncbi:DUF3168 domain-containing protein [Rubellimicrobium arenae]|uniref:DUF3168 domain-containing protein n=1 Tax=Rubellimicrobium arenae TaxID=2817372 RepID=UPI001B309092|nr:DUF3168 domain-containing protein [Rubellimicrobium arenae]